MKFSAKKGSALLIVLWAMIVMSVTVLSLVEFVGFGLDENVTLAKDFRARQLAESGLAIGMHPAVGPNDDVLKQTLGAGERFEARVTSEGARVNINFLLANNERMPLRSLFEKWGVSADHADVVVDSLLDWVSPDGVVHLNGAGRDYYAKIGHPEYPRNHPFQSVAEMRLVRGMEWVEKAKPDWKDFFTIWGDGKLDMNEADEDLITVICGISSLQAHGFVEQRWGPDGQPGTKDDIRFTYLDQVRIALGLSESSFQAIENQITVDTPVVRIESTGYVRDYKRTIILIVQRNALSPQYLAWLEP